MRSLARVTAASRILLQETSQLHRATDRNRPQRARRRAGFASKELIQETIRSEQSDGSQYTNVGGRYRFKPIQSGSPTRARTWDLRINSPSGAHVIPLHINCLQRPRNLAIAVECSATQGHAKQRWHIFGHTSPRLTLLDGLHRVGSSFTRYCRSPVLPFHTQA